MTEVEKPKVAEAKPEHQSDSSTDSESDEEIPELEDAGNANSGAGAFPGASATGLPIDMVSKAKQSRGEKKSSKNYVEIRTQTSKYPKMLSIFY